MKVVTYGAGDMIKLSCASDESHCCILYRLKQTKVDLTDTIQDTVAIVQATRNHDMDQRQ